jgi:RNA polymerase sigma-70 factor (ECF subfamily)
VTVDALRRGEPEVLGELLRVHGREIQGVAYLILRDRSLAEDVLMDTLLSALDKASSLRDATALRPWLLRIATNHALGRRRRGARVAYLAVLPDTAEPVADPDDHVLLMEALERLPGRTRAAVALHYYADLPVSDVAAAMGTSTNTVKTQLRRALQAMRAQLAEAPAANTTAEVAHG